MIPYTPQAYKLLHEGSIALAEVEANGMRVDMDYLERTIRKTHRRVQRMEAGIKGTDVYRAWHRTFGGKMKLGSREQLKTVLFKVLKIDKPDGMDSMDETSLNLLNHPFVKDWLAIEKLKKTSSTYLVGIQRQVVDGLVHPFFPLHTTRTYRGSSSDPNFQNIPIRVPETGRLVRRAFIPRKGRQVGEMDIKGNEVRFAACYHKDPRMIEYICDESKDMHRDMAMECFLLPQDQVNKGTRSTTKSLFVFAQFYGDWYIDCAKRLWEAIELDKLTTADGVPIKKHLAGKGIVRLGNLDPKREPLPGSFEGHIKAVERNFWKKRFPVYDKWKRTWVDAYRSKGYIQTLTGFVCQGYMKKNEIINYGIQGSAFHGLLWSLTRLIRYEMRKRRMKTLIVGQIHDSIVSDIVPEERDDYIMLCRDVVTRQLREEWPWLIVPMDVEMEIAGIDEPWANKKAII